MESTKMSESTPMRGFYEDESGNLYPNLTEQRINLYARSLNQRLKNPAVVVRTLNLQGIINTRSQDGKWNKNSIRKSIDATFRIGHLRYDHGLIPSYYLKLINGEIIGEDIPETHGVIGSYPEGTVYRMPRKKKPRPWRHCAPSQEKEFDS